MRKCLLHSENRSDAPWKAKAPSKRKSLLSLKSIRKTDKEVRSRRINTARVDSSKIHEQRVLFNKQHFGCKEFYHQNGEKTWLTPIRREETPAITIKRIVQILVPSNFFCVTNKTRKKVVYKKDVCHRVVSSEETVVNITAHGGNAAKWMLLKEGISEDYIIIKSARDRKSKSCDLCYVTLHKQVTEEKIRELFPTLHIRVFKVQR